MSNFSFLSIKYEKVVAKRKLVTANIIGRSFANTLPFLNNIRILDSTEDKITFHSLNIIPIASMLTKGEIEFIEEGVKTRVKVSMSLAGKLAMIYLLHWIPALILYLIQGVWATLINPEMIELMQGWVLFALLLWPLLVFWFVKKRINLRLEAYLHNLMFYS